MENLAPDHPPINVWVSTAMPPVTFVDELGCFQLLLLHPQHGIRQGFYDFRDEHFYGSVVCYRSLDDQLVEEVNNEENINQNLYQEVEADNESTHWMLLRLPEGLEKCQPQRPA